jgi:Mg-chelatase subunit ChlD
MEEAVVKDGPKRINVVKSELKTLLTVMPNGARINLVFFGEKVEAWSPGPRALDTSSREDATRFVGALNPHGRTILFDGLAHALQDAATAEGQGVADGVDTIYLLSDGEPTHGTVGWSNVCQRVVRRLARTTRVTVHCVAVGEVGTLLKTIAADSGGEYVQR